MLKLEVLPAGKGDCLILHYGSDKNPKLAVIDGGPGGTYRDQLEPRLKGLRTQRGLTAQQALGIDLLMISHIDDDHINGVLALARQMDNAKREGDPQAFRPRRLWHNSFDDLIGNDEADTKAALVAQFGTASVAVADIPDDAPLDDDSRLVLASLKQGHDLRDYAKALNWPINPDFGGALVQASDTGAVARTLDGVRFTIVSPMAKEIADLQAEHKRWLSERATRRGEGPALVAAFSDTSVANLSSIVVHVDDGKRRLLLTGDARGDKVMAGLEAAGLLPVDGAMVVDVLKVPHHGSDRNVARPFFERVKAGTYVFSGNGEHGNPDRGTIEMLFAARPEGGYTLHFTYPLAAIDAERRRFAERHEKPFDPQRHALATLLAGTLPPGVGVVTQDGKPLVV